MSDPNPPAAQQGRITSFAQLHQIREQEREAARSGANGARCADFPTTDEGLSALIDKLVDAMDNMVDIVDNVDLDKPDDNADAKKIRRWSRDRKIRKAWDCLVSVILTFSCPSLR